MTNVGRMQLRDVIGQVITVGSMIVFNDESTKLSIGRVVSLTDRYVRIELIDNTKNGKSIRMREASRVLVMCNSPEFTLWLLKNGS